MVAKFALCVSPPCTQRQVQTAQSQDQEHHIQRISAGYGKPLCAIQVPQKLLGSLGKRLLPQSVHVIGLNLCNTQSKHQYRLCEKIGGRRHLNTRHPIAPTCISTSSNTRRNGAGCWCRVFGHGKGKLYVSKTKVIYTHTNPLRAKPIEPQHRKLQRNHDRKK